MAFQFPGSLDELVHNRPAMIGLAGAGGLGLFVWYRHKKAGGSAGATTDAVNAGQLPAGYAGGTFDTSATDLASYLGDFSQGLNNQLNDWLKQAQGQLMPPPDSTPSPSPPTPGGANNNKGPAITQVTVKPGWSVVNTIKSLQSQGVNITYDRLVQLNPGVLQNINWAGKTQPRAWDSFRSPATYKLA